MSYGIVHQFAGGTEDQYKASLAAVHPSDGGLPEGQVFQRSLRLRLGGKRVARGAPEAPPVADEWF